MASKINTHKHSAFKTSTLWASWIIAVVLLASLMAFALRSHASHWLLSYFVAKPKNVNTAYSTQPTTDYNAPPSQVASNANDGYCGCPYCCGVPN